MKLIILIFLLISNVLCTCTFKNSTNTNQYYLTVETTLNCNIFINGEVSCEHIFNETCPYAYEWIKHPGNICSKYCCVDINNTNERKIKFICKCPSKININIKINDTVEIFTNNSLDCSSPTPAPTPSDDEYILIFIAITVSILIFIVIICIIIYNCCRYIQRRY